MSVELDRIRISSVHDFYHLLGDHYRISIHSLYKDETNKITQVDERKNKTQATTSENNTNGAISDSAPPYNSSLILPTQVEKHERTTLKNEQRLALCIVKLQYDRYMLRALRLQVLPLPKYAVRYLAQNNGRSVSKYCRLCVPRLLV